MKKQLITVLCGALAVAMAVPAMATHELGGILRTQGVTEDVGVKANTDLDGDGDADVYNVDTRAKRFIAQRLRAKWTNTINDYVTVIWYGEVDTTWGADGGKESADAKNVETKNVYAIIKVPGDLDVTVKAGIQGFKDNLSSTYFHNDAAALITTANFGTASATVGMSKLQENDAILGDDEDMYFVQASIMPAETMKFGAEIWNFHDGAGNGEYKTDIYTIGLNGMVKVADMVTIDGWLGFQNGTRNIDAGSEQDISTMAMSIAAKAKMDNMKYGLRIIYFGADDDAKDDMGWEGFKGGLPFYTDNMPIMLANAYKTQVMDGQGFSDQQALDYVKAGFGLFALIADVNASFDPFWVRGTLGIFNAIDDTADDAATAQLEGTDIATEICVQVGMTVAEAAKLSVRTSYAALGSAFDGRAYNTKTMKAVEPDDMYTMSLILDVPF